MLVSVLGISKWGLILLSALYLFKCLPFFPGRGKVSRKDFVRLVVEVFKAREHLLELIESQEGVRKVFRRLVAFFVYFIGMLVFLAVAGVSVNTLIISGVASLSSLTVALSE